MISSNIITTIEIINLFQALVFIIISFFQIKKGGGIGTIGGVQSELAQPTPKEVG